MNFLPNKKDESVKQIPWEALFRSWLKTDVAGRKFLAFIKNAQANSTLYYGWDIKIKFANNCQETFI